MDAFEATQKFKKDISILRLLFLLVFPKTLMVFVVLIGYLLFVS